MELSEIFFNRWERLRSGWRVLLFVIFNYLLTTVLVTAVVVVYYIIPRLWTRASIEEALSGPLGWIIQSFVLLGAATVAGILCARFLEDLPARALGWTLHAGCGLDFLKGAVVGGLSLILAALMIFLGRGYQFSFGAASAGALLQTLIGSGLIFLLAASAEEALFRGYPLQTMTRARLALVGVVLTSLVFAYVHRNNPNNPQGLAPFTYLGINFIHLPFINTTLAGVWLAAAYLRTRSLWFPLGLHWSWNWTMGALLGLPVSGIEQLTPTPLLRATAAGPVWLTGGAYGVEGSVTCTIAILVSIAFIWYTRWLAPTPEMLSLTDKENPKRREIKSDGQDAQDKEEASLLS